MENKTSSGYPPIAAQCTWIRVNTFRNGSPLGLRKLAVEVHPPHCSVKYCVVGMMINLN